MVPLVGRPPAREPLSPAVGAPAGDPAADPGPPSPRSAWRRAAHVLFPILGLLLLGLVLHKVPWRDHLSLADGRVLTGEALSSDGEGVEFLEAGRDAPETWAPHLLAVRPEGLPSLEVGVLALSRRIRPGPALLALGLNAVMLLMAVVRWKMLLEAQGIVLPLRENAALSLLGNFFNQVVPGGIVGGDVLKAVYAARGRERAAPAVVSIFVDRVAGLLGAVLLAGVALVPRLEDRRFLGPALLCYGVIAAQLVLMGILFSRRVRRWLRLERGFRGVPFVGAFLDEGHQAVLLYRSRAGTVVAVLGISVAIHVSVCAINALLGSVLGIDLPAASYFAIVPAILVVSAIPLLPGGWGVGEAAYVLFLGMAGVPPAQAVALSILWRTIQLLWALPGGVVFLLRTGAVMSRRRRGT